MSEWEKRSAYFWLCLALLVISLSSCANPDNYSPTRVKNSVTGQVKPSPTSIPNDLSHCKGKDASATNDGKVHILVDKSCSATSQFALGLTHINNEAALPSESKGSVSSNDVRSLLKTSVSYQNTHIMGWGLPDPWPDPANPEPTNWSALDNRVQLAVDTGSTPVLSLDEAPWWMKGSPLAGGKAQTLTAAQEWSSAAYSTRILDNKMDAWLHLVQRVAERYMVPPYNVRYFQVWNELKGYYNPGINNYDFTTNPGNSNGVHANHGYTYMYNQVYNAIMKVAQAHGISTDSVKIGGPYVFMDVWSAKQPSNPSNLVKPYGTFDQRPFDVIEYWLQHKVGAGFITIDSSIENREERPTSNLAADPFVASEKFADVVKWVHSLDPSIYPGSTTLPVWFAEWFSYPRNNILNASYDNALKSYTMIKFLKAGGAVALAWGESGDGWSDKGLWTAAYAGNAQPEPWYYSASNFKSDFAPGTKIYSTTVSAPEKVEALVSDSKLMLVNKTSASVTVNINSQDVLLTPYQVKVIAYSS